MHLWTEEVGDRKVLWEVRVLTNARETILLL